VDGLRGDDRIGINQPLADKSGILFGHGTVTRTRPVRMADVSDGLSNTLMVGERPPSADLEFGWWFAGTGFDGSGVGDVVLGANETQYYKGLANYGCPAAGMEGKLGLKPGLVTDNCDMGHFWSLHAGGANFLLGDGSVRFLPFATDPTTFQYLCTRNGGEVIPGF
jgi:prepilin-type processing-associated H-X9-DG protein